MVDLCPRDVCRCNYCLALYYALLGWCNEFGHAPICSHSLFADVDKAIGGVQQLYHHVNTLLILVGFCIVTEFAGFRPSWFDSDAPSLSFEECIGSDVFSPEKTILVLPETYLGVNLFSYRGLDLSAFARVIVNKHYSYGQGGEDVSSNADVL